MVKNKKSCKCKKESDNCKCNKLTTCNYTCNNICCNDYYKQQVEPVQYKKPKKDKRSKYGKTNKLGKRQKIAKEGNRIIISDTNKAPRINIEDTATYRTQNALLNSLSSIPLLTNVLGSGRTNTAPLISYQPRAIKYEDDPDYTELYERMKKDGRIPEDGLISNPYSTLRDYLNQNLKIEITSKGASPTASQTASPKTEKTSLSSVMATPATSPKVSPSSSPRYERIAQVAYGNQKQATIQRVREAYNNFFKDKTKEEIIETIEKDFGRKVHRGTKTIEGIVGTFLQEEDKRVNKKRGGASGGGSSLIPIQEEPPSLTDLDEEPDTPAYDAMKDNI